MSPSSPPSNESPPPRSPQIDNFAVWLLPALWRVAERHALAARLSVLRPGRWLQLYDDEVVLKSLHEKVLGMPGYEEFMLEAFD